MKQWIPKIALGICLLFSKLSYSQLTTISNERVFGGDNDESVLFCFQIPDGDKILIGTSNSGQTGDKSQSNFGNTDIWVLRIDTENNKIWDKSFGGESEESVDIDACLFDEKIYISVPTLSGASGNKTTEKIAEFPRRDLWVFCLDLDGEFIWQKSYSDTISGFSKMNFFSTSQNQLMLAGIQNQNFNRYLMIYELDENTGDVISNVLFQSQNLIVMNDIFVCENGDILFSIWCTQGVSGIKTDPGYGYNNSVLILKPNLTYKNFKCLGSNTGFLPVKTDVIEKDGFIYLSTTHGPSDLGIGNKTASSFNNSNDTWLVKLDLDLNIIWDKTYGGTGNEEGVQLLVNDDRIMMVMRSVSLSNLTEGNKTNPGFGNYDALMMTIDNDGNIISQATIGGSISDNGNVLIYDSSDGKKGFFYGTSNSPISGLKTLPSKGSSDFWIFDVELSELLQVNESHTLGKISVFPNPTSGELTFQLPENQNELTLNIYSHEGKLVYHDRIDSHAASKTISLDVPAGVLLYTLSSDVDQVSGKIIKL